MAGDLPLERRWSLPVEVVRSRRRRKTVEAQMLDGVIRVSVPAWMSEAEEDEYVTHLVDKLQQKYRSDHVDLQTRAATLARRYELPSARSVRWSDNQRSRWGSCTVTTGEIRISSRLSSCPTWVLDYVIVHELAHLAEANHGPRFDALVARYPKAERAIGYLLARDLADEPAEPEARALPVEEVVVAPEPDTQRRLFDP